MSLSWCAATLEGNERKRRIVRKSNVRFALPELQEGKKGNSLLGLTPKFSGKPGKSVKALGLHPMRAS